MKASPDIYSDDSLLDKEKGEEQVSITPLINNEKEDSIESPMLSDYKKNIQAWKDFFRAISTDQKAIERKIQSFENKKLMWKINYLDTLLGANDEKLEEEYVKYFEPQTSSLYLWWFLSALDHEAFQMWFFGEMNWIQDNGMEEKIIQRINVLDRLVNIAKKIDKKNKLESLHEELYK